MPKIKMNEMDWGGPAINLDGGPDNRPGIIPFIEGIGTIKRIKDAKLRKDENEKEFEKERETLKTWMNPRVKVATDLEIQKTQA